MPERGWHQVCLNLKSPSTCPGAGQRVAGFDVLLETKPWVGCLFSEAQMWAPRRQSCRWSKFKTYLLLLLETHQCGGRCRVDSDVLQVQRRRSPVLLLVQVNIGILIAVTRVISQISADNYKIHGDPSAFK